MRYLRILGLALVLTALLFPARLGVAQERGITPTEIIIGSTVPLSGPAAYWGLGVGGGIDTYLKSINDAGGIHGRKFRTVLLDDSYLPARAAVNVRDLVERHNVFAIVGMIGTANAFASRGYILESKVLWITPTTNDIWAGLRPEQKKYLFVTYPSYLNEGRILTQYAAEKLGTKQIAVFYQNDEYGLGLLRGVKYGVAAVKGVKFVGQASYEVTDADVSAQAVKLRASGADTVFIAATPNQGALIVREMAKLGWRPQLLSTFTLGDPIMFRLAGEAWNDIYAGAYFPVPGTDPKLDETLANLVRLNPGLRVTPYNALAGVSFIEPLVEALRRVGPNPTKDRVVEAMESIRNWDGAVARSVTFGKDRHQGLNRIFIVKAQGGQYVKVTDWISYPTSF
ncbi:MAG TPA: ABC transporter substrate-binding protein [bacterium]|nr:ABC transporter substrate-binding protein [bacterium]